MMNLEILKRIGLVGLCLSIAACTIPTTIQKTENNVVPESYNASIDTTNSARIQWRDFFKDPYLTALIDTALRNNQELNIMLQEIQISQNEIRARKGEYLPFVGLMAGAEVEKVGRYTSQGANDANTEIKPGEEFPEPLPNFTVAAYATWELDIWNKLHNAKRSAVLRYLSSIEGKNFMVTHLI
ncbi:MAG: TolC family protein, partial [Cyclobacteriaceae bacterium]|nr:TolC family protein [Cyclobacteriaceae bacterium]